MTVVHSASMIRLHWLAVLALFACGPAAAQPQRPEPRPRGPGSTTSPPAPTPGTKKRPLGPTREKAASLREAADLLDKAQAALDEGNRNLAEQLFSTAELLTGADAVADLAATFRAGAPPRVTTPTFKVEDKGRQQRAVGNSDEDDKDKPAERGSLDGSLKIGGQPPGGALAFVTLEPSGRRGKARAPKQRIMEQRDRQFAPRLMLVPVGSKVTFPNFDRVFHNVFSTSTAAAFDLGLYKEGQAREVTFSKEGIVRVGCNLHANMAATVVVIGAPHYVFVEDDGAFRFASLAPGKYKLRAWSEKSNEPVTQDVTIKAGKNTVSVGVAADGKSGPMADKFGSARAAKK